ANVDRATRHRHPQGRHAEWFSRMLQDDGEWGFRDLEPQYEFFRYLHLGVVGAAMGLPRGVLLRYTEKRCATAGVLSAEAGALITLGHNTFRKRRRRGTQEGFRSPPCNMHTATTIHRLSDLDGWEFYEIAGDAVYVIGMRAHFETRQIEY